MIQCLAPREQWLDDAINSYGEDVIGFLSHVTTRALLGLKLGEEELCWAAGIATQNARKNEATKDASCQMKILRDGYGTAEWTWSPAWSVTFILTFNSHRHNSAHDILKQAISAHESHE